MTNRYLNSKTYLRVYHMTILTARLSINYLKRMSKHKEELSILCRTGIVHP